MITIYFENGPLAGQTRQVRDGTTEHYEPPEHDIKLPYDSAGNSVADPAAVQPWVRYYRAGVLRDEMPVFRCEE